VAIDNDIIKLLKSEGLKTNEAIMVALSEFIDVVEDENESMGEGVANEDKEAEEEAEEAEE
jgi:hypothetical protein